MHKLKILVSMSAICLSLSSALAQERKIEESLVFSDPTVAKQKNGWSGGVFLDVVRATSGITVYDTSGSSHSANSTGTKTGFSGYIGKGDISYLFSYHPASGNVTVSTGTSTADNIITKADVYEMNIRYLDRANSSWYVPYYMAGFAYIKSSWTVTTVVQNGVTEVNTNNGFIPEIGAGVIIPRTDKYGYRIDGRIGLGPMHQRSNLFSQWNKDSIGGFIRPTATFYYNFTDSINLQAGVQYDSFLQGTGTFLQLGTKF